MRVLDYGCGDCASLLEIKGLGAEPYGVEVDPTVRDLATELGVRVHVGPDGEPRDIDLVNSSGSRSLDRAAVDAVERWRFAPAMRGETPVEGSVQVPIEFSLGR